MPGVNQTVKGNASQSFNRHEHATLHSRNFKLCEEMLQPALADNAQQRYLRISARLGWTELGEGWTGEHRAEAESE